MPSSRAYAQMISPSFTRSASWTNQDRRPIALLPAADARRRRARDHPRLDRRSRRR